MKKSKEIRLSEIVLVYGCNPLHVFDAMSKGELTSADGLVFDREQVKNWYNDKIKNIRGER
jgi:hypothetical protein